MHSTLVYVAFGFLILSGTLHFAIDVVSQYVRKVRAPSRETTLYWGLHSSYSLGQVLFGVFAILVQRSAPDVLTSWPALLLSGLAAASWLAVAFAFIEYRPPKLMAGIFATLVLALIVMS